MNLPRGRRDDLLTTKLDDEVVVYDPETKQAHSLNRLAVSVWNHADGAETVADLQAKVSSDVGVAIDEAAVLSALRKLERANLLLEKAVAVGPMTRREILRKGGKLGAAAAVTPLIASALVPMAAAAQSDLCAQGTVCATLILCGNGGPFGVCDCFQRAGTGNGFCGQSILCATATTCTTDADCPAGAPVCTTNTCCGPQGICEVPCNAPFAPSQVLHGLTSSGQR